VSRAAGAAFRAERPGSGDGATAPRQARSAPAGNRSVGEALARHGDETFAARARLAAQQPGLHRRPRIWDMEDAAVPATSRTASVRAESRGGRGDWLDRIDQAAEPAPRAATANAVAPSDPAGLPAPADDGSGDGPGRPEGDMQPGAAASPGDVGADAPAAEPVEAGARGHRRAPLVLGATAPAPAGVAPEVPAADDAGRDRRQHPPQDPPAVDIGRIDAGSGAAGTAVDDPAATARPDDISADMAAPEELRGNPDDPVAYARAQLARMAELGLAGAGADVDDGAAGPGGGGRTARARTRVLGFRPPEADADPFGHGGSAAANRGPDYPVGWLVVVEGAGRGASFALTSGVATLGRGDDQTVRLDFGDTAISRQAHASIAFDDETGRFFLGAGSRTNLVRRNGRPVLATEEVAGGDEIRLGETVLRLVALCGEGFSWGGGGAGGA
jgi:hypothetical protein